MELVNFDRFVVLVFSPTFCSRRLRTPWMPYPIMPSIPLCLKTNGETVEFPAPSSARRRAITGQPNRSDLAPRRPRRYESQSAGSRNKPDSAASIHIGIATGSVNKMKGTRNNAAQMQKITASTMTEIKNQ